MSFFGSLFGTNKRLIRVAYEIVTPESAEHGDAAERGWIDEEGMDMTPDQDDQEEGITAVDNAVKFLKREYVSEASSDPWHPNAWYIADAVDTDYKTGAVENRSYHLYGFTPEEQAEIYSELFPKRVRSKKGDLKGLRGSRLGDVDDFLDAYLATAAWTLNEEYLEQLGTRQASEDDFALKTAKALKSEARKWFLQNKELIEEAAATGAVSYGPDLDSVAARAGHDFWLTRNGHGVGFWDGDWPEPFAKKLTDAAHEAGEIDLYVSDRGNKIHSSGKVNS